MLKALIISTMLMATSSMAQRHDEVVYKNRLRNPPVTKVCITKKYCLKEDTRVFPEKK